MAAAEGVFFHPVLIAAGGVYECMRPSEDGGFASCVGRRASRMRTGEEGLVVEVMVEVMGALRVVWEVTCGAAVLLVRWCALYALAWCLLVASLGCGRARKGLRVPAGTACERNAGISRLVTMCIRVHR
ncbi:hypothetical protein PLESTF_001268000 [Pleodorina starrii]|nr:hypothetical protein PLESTM_000455100 [Pleodorina starrii]GLC72591.1 hypothetical protein PLESTF_001268000 [Pleodorina starrii]